jgi:hypothetical protein
MASSSSLKRKGLSLNSPSSNEGELPAENIELIKRFLINYIYSIFEDDIFKKIADKSTRVDRSVEEFNNSMNLVCDIFQISKETKTSKPSKRSKSTLFETFQSSQNKRFRELFEKLQPSILTTISRISTFTPENIYNETSVYHLYMHGSYDFTSSADMLNVVPDNVILVFNTPINRLGICANTKERELIIEKLQTSGSRHKILSQIGCVDKHIDKSEFDNSTLSSKTFMSRALVLYPGQCYYNIKLGFDKLKDKDKNLGVYIINEKIANNCITLPQIKTDLKTVITTILRSPEHPAKIKYIFVDCCRSLNDEIIKRPKLADQYTKIIHEMYEYEHFMYYFNIAMNSCEQSIESSIPRSLFIKKLSHLNYDDFLIKINQEFHMYDSISLAHRLAQIFKDKTKHFLTLKINTPTKPPIQTTLGNILKLKDNFADDYSPDNIDPYPLVINPHDILNSYYQHFLKYLIINKFIKAEEQTSMKYIINLSDEYKKIYYAKKKIEDFLISPYDEDKLKYLLKELNLTQQPPLTNLMILANYFLYIIKIYKKLKTNITLPPIFVTNQAILQNIYDFLKDIIKSTGEKQQEFNILKLQNYKYIGIAEITKERSLGNNLIFLYYFVNYNLLNLVVNYFYNSPDFMLPEQVTALKKNMRSRGSRSRSSLKKIMTEKVDLREVEDIVNDLAIYPNTDAKASQAGGSSKNHLKLNTKKRKNPAVSRRFGGRRGVNPRI